MSDDDFFDYMNDDDNDDYQDDDENLDENLEEDLEDLEEREEQLLQEKKRLREEYQRFREDTYGFRDPRNYPKDPINPEMPVLSKTANMQEIRGFKNKEFEYKRLLEQNQKDIERNHRLIELGKIDMQTLRQPLIDKFNNKYRLPAITKYWRSRCKCENLSPEDLKTIDPAYLARMKMTWNIRDKVYSKCVCYDIRKLYLHLTWTYGTDIFIWKDPITGRLYSKTQALSIAAKWAQTGETCNKFEKFIIKPIADRYVHVNDPNKTKKENKVIAKENKRLFKKMYGGDKIKSKRWGDVVVPSDMYRRILEYPTNEAYYMLKYYNEAGDYLFLPLGDAHNEESNIIFMRENMLRKLGLLNDMSFDEFVEQSYLESEFVKVYTAKMNSTATHPVTYSQVRDILNDKNSKTDYKFQLKYAGIQECPRLSKITDISIEPLDEKWMQLPPLDIEPIENQLKHVLENEYVIIDGDIINIFYEGESYRLLVKDIRSRRKRIPYGISKNVTVNVTIIHAKAKDQE